MMKHLLIFLTLMESVLLISSDLQAQEFLHIPNENGRSSINLGDLEMTFQNWAKDKDLSRERGWKWYARWLNEQISRADINGEIADQRPLFEAALEIVRQKQSAVSARTSGNWMPVGPVDIPSVPNNTLFHGMGRINTIAFHPTDKETFWVGVAQGGVWKTTNSGQSWMPLTDELPILRVSDIAVDPTNPDVMYISVGDYAYLGVALETTESKRNTHYGLGVYKTTDGGQNWSPTGLTFDQKAKDASLTRRLFINHQNSNELVAAGIHGVWKSQDGGDNWTQVMDRMVSDFERDPTQPNTIFMSTAYVSALQSGYAAIWKSTDFGDTWQELNTNIPTSQAAQRIELSVSPANHEYVYALAAGTDGGLYGLYRSTDHGESWELRMNSENILHWNDPGQSGGQGNYDLALLADPNDAEKLYAGGVNMWGSDDGGSTWKAVSYWRPNYGASLHADHHYYAYNPLDTKFYVCHDGGVNRTSQIHMTDWDVVTSTGGFRWETTWEEISGGMQITSFYRMGIKPGNSSLVIAGAQDNSTFVKTGDQWINTVLGDGMECFIHPADESIMFASTQGGSFYRSENGGQTFSSGLTSAIRGSENGEWTTPVAMHPTDINTLFVGFGNIWESNDLGDTWKKVSNLSPIPGTNFIIPTSTMTVAPTDPNTIYVGKRIYPTFGTKGEFWRTDDGGTNMKNVSTGLPTDLYFTSSTVSNLNSMDVWVTTGGFSEGHKVYYSSNGGNGWSNISKNLPNIPVNSIKFQPHSTNNTVYIGTDLGVYFINDDMEEWQLYSDNLPNVIVTDLEIDHESNKIYASTFGRGIWVSDLAEQFDPTVGIEDALQIDLSLYPNPNNGQLRIELDNPQLKNLSLEIRDIKGTVVYRKLLQQVEDVYRLDLDLKLEFGLYFVRVASEKQGSVVKFVVE